MKRILLLHNTLDRGGGAEKMRHTLLKNLGQREYKVKVCCLGIKGALGELIEGLGYEVDELRLNHRPANLLTTFKLIKYLRRQNVDVIHTCLFDSNFHGRIAALICRVPHVITEEHSEHFLYRRFRHFFYIYSDYFLSKITDFIICCSESVEKDIGKKENLPHEKLLTIKNCIDPEMYKVETAREQIRRKFNIGSEPVFITTASFAPKKRHSYLLSILKRLKDAGYEFRCFFAGDGVTKTRVMQKTEELGLSDNVIFLGKIDNVQDYLNASDVFVLPSMKEGLSIALMEAMYMGLLCVVTDIDANKELIENRVNGILVPLDDTDEFVNALMYCIKNKEAVRVMGQKARVTIDNGYLVDDYVDKFHKVWDGLNNK